MSTLNDVNIQRAISASMIGLLALCTAAPDVLAQNVGTTPAVQSTDDTQRPAAADPKVPAIEINGSRASDTEQRRQSTASKLIYGREELDRNGDSTLGEILKRLPGVTIGGRPGRGGEIRMRGLGGGYTQILLNGERPPRGFSLDSLAPDQIERIEIIRGTVAEHSTRAVAGTINIVLRDGYQQKDTQLKLTDTIEQGRHRPNVALTVPGKSGALTWLFSGTVSENHQHDDSTSLLLDTSAAGQVQKEQQVNDSSDRKSRSIHLTPRLSYKFDNGDTLVLQPFLMSTHSTSTNDSLLLQTAGLVPPEYAQAEGSASASSTFLRTMGNWVHRAGPGARVDVKFGFGTGHSDNAALRDQFNAGGALQDRFIDTDSTHDRSATLGVKYHAPIGAGHQLATGADGEFGHRDETRVALDNGKEQFADSGDNLSADTRRLAAFIQDDWDITPQWAVNLGLRWEGIRTLSSNASGQVSNTSSVWSPVFHVVWRIPGYARDQVRSSLTHSYRAPNLNDLIAAPTFSRLNSPTRPDRVGNPDLKPELAQGLDLAYEHYLGNTGIVSAGGFVRKIDQLMRRETSLRTTPTGPRWVSAPANIGSAVTSGIELEAKCQLLELMPDAPDLDIRTNYSHFWSHVDDVPGPNNRLAQQARETANIGIDYRLRVVPLTVGSNLNWTPATLVQNSASEVVSTDMKRQLDVYALWRFNPRWQLRLAANNLAPRNYNTGRVVTTDGLVQSAQNFARTYTTWNIKLEIKL